MTINGRLDRPGEVDRFRVEVKAGDRFRARVEAAGAGSWLDSVLTILGPRGEVLAENDDRKPRTPLEPPTTIDGAPTPDSEVDVLIREDGPITVELADRAGASGPEYGYRLELGPPRIDFSVHLLPTPSSADPGPAARAAGQEAAADVASRPGAAGAFNLAPGSTTVVPLVIVPRGRPGTIDVEAVDLPDGIRVEPLAVRTSPAPRSAGRAGDGWDAPAEVHAFRFVAASEAAGARGAFRVVAASRPPRPGGASIRREGDAVVGVDAAGGPGRPVVRRLTSFPIRVTGPR